MISQDLRHPKQKKNITSQFVPHATTQGQKSAESSLKKCWAIEPKIKISDFLLLGLKPKHKSDHKMNMVSLTYVINDRVSHLLLMTYWLKNKDSRKEYSKRRVLLQRG